MTLITSAITSQSDSQASELSTVLQNLLTAEGIYLLRSTKNPGLWLCRSSVLWFILLSCGIKSTNSRRCSKDKANFFTFFISQTKLPIGWTWTLFLSNMLWRLQLHLDHFLQRVTVCTGLFKRITGLRCTMLPVSSFKANGFFFYLSYLSFVLWWKIGWVFLRQEYKCVTFQKWHLWLSQVCDRNALTGCT